MGTAEIRAGLAFVELVVNADGLKPGLANARRHLVRFAADVFTALSPSRWLKSMGDAIASMGQRMAAAGTAAALAFVPTVRAASTATETLNKFRAVFASQADAAGLFADNLADGLGRSRYEIRDSMSAFQAFFVGLDFAPDKARQFSQELQKAAIDFGSFYNVSDEEASQRFISALSGSSEVLDRFGINLKQAAIEQELLNQGVTKSWQDVTEAEKAVARFNVILRALGAQGALGDAARTAGSFANLWKSLRGAINEAAVEIGKALLPVLEPLTKRVTDAAKAFSQWIATNPQLVRNLAGGAVKLAAFGAALIAVGKALAIAGAVLGLVFTLSKLWLIGTVIIPVLLKLAAALHVTTVSVTALKLALTTLGPTIAATGAALGGLVLVLGAIAAAYVNAKIQGISYGDSVLDLTHKITGLHNAYSSLKAVEAQEAKATDIVRELETAFKSRDLAGLDAGLGKLRQHRENVAASLNEIVGDGWVAESELNTVENLRMELQRLDLIISRFAGKRTEVAIKGFLGDLATSARNTGQQIGEGLWAGIKLVFEKFEEAARRFGPALARAQAEAIEDPLERQIALINIDYDQRVAEAERENLPTDILDKARKQEIANARAAAGRDAAEDEKQRAEEVARNQRELDYELERADIEANQKGRDRERALIELERRRALEDAQAKGTDVEKVNRLYDLKLQQLGAGELAERVQAGTFSGRALAGMAGGNWTDRLLRANEQQNKKQDQANELLTRIERKTGAGLAIV